MPVITNAPCRGLKKQFVRIEKTAIMAAVNGSKSRSKNFILSPDLGTSVAVKRGSKCGCKGRRICF